MKQEKFVQAWWFEWIGMVFVVCFYEEFGSVGNNVEGSVDTDVCTHRQCVCWSVNVVMFALREDSFA